MYVYLSASGIEDGLENELGGDLDDVLAVNRLVGVCCLRCCGGRRGRSGDCDGCWRACCGGRGRRTQGVDEVGIGTAEVVTKASRHCR